MTRVGIVVEALRIQRGRWAGIFQKMFANDASVSTISPDEAVEALRLHEELLDRLPNRSLPDLSPQPDDERNPVR